MRAGSIELARRRAVAAGVADRVTFEVARATDYAGSGYDLVAYFDCLHMGDPVAAARHTRKSIAADGVWMIVEPAVEGGVRGGLARAEPRRGGRFSGTT